MRFRLTARQRLRNARDFETVRRHGRAFQSAPFLFTLYSPELEEGSVPVCRMGVIASRRVGNAVVRNRCKRICRELFRIHQHSLPAHCDCVFLVRKKFTNFTFEDLEKKFVQAYQYLTPPNRPAQ